MKQNSTYKLACESPSFFQIAIQAKICALYVCVHIPDTCKMSPRKTLNRGLGDSSGGKVIALQAQGPEFDLQKTGMAACP